MFHLNYWEFPKSLIPGKMVLLHSLYLFFRASATSHCQKHDLHIPTCQSFSNHRWLLNRLFGEWSVFMVLTQHSIQHETLILQLGYLHISVSQFNFSTMLCSIQSLLRCYILLHMIYISIQNLNSKTQKLNMPPQVTIS